MKHILHVGKNLLLIPRDIREILFMKYMAFMTSRREDTRTKQTYIDCCCAE